MKVTTLPFFIGALVQLADSNTGIVYAQIEPLVDVDVDVDISVQTRDVNGCFPGNARVLTSPHGQVNQIKHVRVGDHVVSVDQGGESKTVEVVYLPHLSNHGDHEFLEIRCDTEETDEEKTIQLTPNHFIFEMSRDDEDHKNKFVAVMAQEVEIGSQLAAWNHSLEFVEPCWVSEITPVILSSGVYTAFTSSGTLVVNDLIVSSYANLRHYGHDSAHSVAAVHRAMYKAGEADATWFRRINDKIEYLLAGKRS